MTLEEIQRMAAKLGLDDKNIKARNIYVNWLYKNFGLITMAGLVDDDAPVQVEAMYVSRFFSEAEVPEEEGSRTIKKAGEDGGKKLDILYWLDKEHFITIAGLPGAGKTWLVHELALETGIRKGTAFNNTYPWIIPIPLILREYDTKKLSSLEELLSAFFDRVIKKNPRFSPKDLDTYRRKGQFLILLDGIDEVGPAHRKKIMAWARETYSKEEIPNRYIVTGRPPGFKGLNTDMPTAEGEDVKLHLLPFTDEQKEEYIKKWHKLRPGASEVEREAKQKSLIGALVDRDYLDTMARRPSFLALICFVHNNLGELPHSRATLYDKIMDAYIMQLEKVRNLSKSRPWEKGDLVFLLSRLALDWQCGADSDNDEERILSEPIKAVKKRFDEYLREKNRYRTIEEGDAENLLPFYLARTGILSEPQAGTVRFAHNSFQEYLTAYYLNVRHQDGTANSFEFLLKRIESEFWRESAHLYLSLRQKDSQNLAYRTILRALDLNKAGQRLFLAEILGSEEIAFSEEERKRWIELLLLSTMGGKGERSLWGALLKRKNNSETVHALCDDWLKKRPASVRDEFKKQWKKINRLSYLGVDGGNRDDPLEGPQADQEEPYLKEAYKPKEDADLFLNSWDIKVILCSFSGDDKTDDAVEKNLKGLDPSLLYKDDANTELYWLIQQTPYYCAPPTPPVSLFWKDLFLIIPQNIAELGRYEWLKKMRAFQLLVLGEILNLDILQDLALDRARALARARARARALDLALARARALARALALALALARALDLALALARALALDLALDLDLDLALDLALALALDLDLDLALDLALDRALALDRDRDLAREGIMLYLSAIFYMTAYCLLGKEGMPSFRKEEFPSEERPGKDEIRGLLKDNTIELEIEGWNDGQYESAKKETFWPGNLARRLRKQMEEQDIETIDFSPEAFTRRFNARVAEFRAKVEAGKQNRKG